MTTTEMNLLSIVELADKVATAAQAIVSGRRTDFRLYAILAGCLEICERCGNPDEEARIRQWHASRPVPNGKNRHYVERGSDIYQVVCRAVFGDGDCSANVNRYAISLRIASQQQIRSGMIVEWLKRNGGVNGLYLRRPLAAVTVKTKCLRLTSQIEIPKGRPFTLTLKRTATNEYQVVDRLS